MFFSSIIIVKYPLIAKFKMPGAVIHFREKPKGLDDVIGYFESFKELDKGRRWVRTGKDVGEITVELSENKGDKDSKEFPYYLTIRTEYQGEYAQGIANNLAKTVAASYKTISKITWVA